MQRNSIACVHNENEFCNITKMPLMDLSCVVMRVVESKRAKKIYFRETLFDRVEFFFRAGIIN